MQGCTYAPREFAWSYIQRSGRIDPEKLRGIAPRFVGAGALPSSA
ncbi:MAG: hypothetical protein WAO95_18090 [Burkholderiales bacterium]